VHECAFIVPGGTTMAAGLIAVDKVGNKLRFYDPASLAEEKALEGPEPCVHELALAPGGGFAFVPLYGDGIYGSNKRPNNKVLVIDLARREIARVIELGRLLAPHGMVAVGDARLWVVCDLARALVEVDPLAGAVLASFECPGVGPHLVAAAADGSKLYVSSKEADLAIFDLARRAFTATIAVGNPQIRSGNGSGSEGLALSPDGSRLVVIDNDRSDLHVIDTASEREIDRVPLAQHPPTNARRSRAAKPMYSPDGRHLAVTSYATGLCWLLDAADLRRQRLVPVAKGPMGMAFVDDAVLVANHDSGLLTRIDLDSARVTGVFDGGAGIEVMAFY
jgi:DNA-binding beta-propeller fold protein YncE